MKLSQIRYFAAVCQYQNFSKAAEALHLSQPGISKSMHELEEECGVALFDRGHNHLAITPAGQSLLKEAKQFLYHAGQLQETIDNLSRQATSLHIGVVPMCGNTVFPRLHKEFTQKQPQMTLSTVEDTASRLYDLLDNHELDFALCVTNHLPNSDYHYLILKKSRLKLFVSSDSAWAKRHEVSLHDLGEIPLVLFSDHFGQARYLKKQFENLLVVPNILHQTSQVFTILEYIRSQTAAGFLSEEFADQEPELVPIDVTELKSGYINLVWNQDETLNPAMHAFLQTVKELFPQASQG